MIERPSVAMETVHDRLSLSATLEAFNALLKEKAGHEAQASVWFKESNARNLRHRDFLAPQAALKARFAGGQVPSDIVESMNVLKCPRVPPIQSCQMVPAGLTVKLARPAVFEQILKAVPVYTKPLQAAHEQHSLLLNCVPLHECQDLKSLSLDHLRAILVTDHLAGLLQTQGIDVHLTPSLSNEELQTFLHQLRVEWPLAREACPNLDPVLAMKEALRQCPHAEFTQMQQDGVFCKLHLKKFLEETQLQEAYDPKLDIFLVTEENLHQVAEVQRVALQCVASAPGRSFSVVHVVNSKEAFQQQKVDLLWRLVSPQAFTHLQKHLVCGPVKTIHSASPLNALEFSQLRHSQMYKASVLKYGDLSQDDTWTEIISTLTTAAIRFEILSIAHQNQILLDVEEMSISTKGTKSGAFVMYNCARLATLFEAYKKAEEQGLYPPFPAPSELDYFSLREEGEWLLLFNGVLPFQEVLSQGMQLPITSSGVRLTANTDAICKFLIQLSMDFSSYYNRVHILGEPRPHLFSQMFARLQLMRAVREVLHSALATLHLPPLSQI